MRDINFRISLDIYELQSQVSLPIKKGDTARRIYISLTKKGMPYAIEEDCVAVFSACKPDGKKIHNDCIIEGNVIRYDITTQTSAVEGIVAAEIILYGADEAVLCAPRFDLVVDDRAAGTETISDDERNYFDAILLSEVDRKESETLRKGNETLRETNEASRASAEGIRIANENERKENESLRIAYENSRLSEEAKRVADEKVRNNNEASRASAENIRVSNENERKNNESQRISGEATRVKNENNRNEAFNKLDIDLKDDGEFVTIVKTNKDGSQEKSTFLKYADVIPSVTATATGSAITIDSANAPLQNLKLFGKTEQDGTPTPDNPIELKSVGDSGSYSVDLYGKNLIDVKDKPTDTVFVKAFSVFLKKGTTLTHSISVSDGKLGSISNGYGYNVAAVWGNYSSGEFELIRVGTILQHDCHSIQVAFSNAAFASGGGTATSFSIQVEIGSQATPFEEYKAKQSLTNTDSLRGIGDIADEKDFARGIKVQRYEKISLAIADMNNSDDYPGWKGVINTSLYFSAIESPASKIPCNISNGNCVGYNKKASVIWLPVSTFGLTQTQWKEQYPNLVVEFLLPLLTPIETPLTETELNDYRQLYTNKGNTTILSEADMEITYYVNKPNAQAIGSLHEQINKDYFKLQQAIISTGGN